MLVAKKNLKRKRRKKK